VCAGRSGLLVAGYPSPTKLPARPDRGKPQKTGAQAALGNTVAPSNLGEGKVKMAVSCWPEGSLQV